MDPWAAIWALLKSTDAAKPYVEVVQSALTSVGIVAGGWWLYHQREQMPRGKVTLEVHSVPLDDGSHLVHVQTTLANLGKVLLVVGRSWTRVQQVRPLFAAPVVRDGEREVAWPTIGSHDVTYPNGKVKIEPGEFESIEDDFLIDSSVEVVQVYSYFNNLARQDEGDSGWGHTALVYISPEKGAVPMSVSKPAIAENTAAAAPKEVRQMAPKPATPPPTKPGAQMPPKAPTPPPPPPKRT